ncbi:Asp23/Gls24 family envelope stress response protein [Dolosigranulum pigrum]|uniref:Asp23/Gls24 family envelope stress response protein n=1 Tax=Dolosigranulum pigrum TaxID=29394 RepID=UPI001AD870B5|nr:Asp23/Gls24 family envelope stress response protein [Dolosigranulum pigrum]QTJ58595.1 Asp23/Gls24 family envelope stress response protein [Dolosigranulum pigrum]
MVKQAKTYNHDKLGDIELAPEVLEVISNIAANEVSGVYALKGTFSTDMKALFTNQMNYKKGVQLSYEQDGINLDVYCNLNLGVNVPKVALEIQERVKEQIYHMTDIELSEVNVHIVSMVSDKV